MAAKDASNMVAPASQGRATSETARALHVCEERGEWAEEQGGEHGDQRQRACAETLIEQKRQRKAHDGGNGQWENRGERCRFRAKNQQQSGERRRTGSDEKDVAEAGNSRGEGDGQQRPPNPGAGPQPKKSSARRKAQRGERQQRDGERPESDLRGMGMRGPGNGHGAGFAQNETQKKSENGDGENGHEPSAKSPQKFHRSEALFVEEPGDFQQQEKCSGESDGEGARGGPANGPGAEEIEIDSIGFRRIGNIGVGEGLDGAEGVVAVMLQRGGVGIFEIVEG